MIGFAQLASILAPLVGGWLGGRGGSSTSTPAGAGTYNPQAADQAELARLALERVKTAQPLYASVMHMANARLPKMYQSGSSTSPTQAGTSPPVQADAQQVPDFAQQIVDEFRRRRGGQETM